MSKTYVKSKMFFKYVFVFCLAYMSSACSHQQVPLQTIFSSNNCAIEEETLKSISEQAELIGLLQSIPKNFGEAPLSVPEVDYEKQSVVLYALGQKSTGGYSIELYKPDATLKKQKLYLPIRVKQPDTNRMHIQLITSPCQVYSLPHTEYSEVIIEDEL